MALLADLDRRVAGVDGAGELLTVPSADPSPEGVHLLSSGLVAVSATAQTAFTAGFLWLLNPPGSAVVMAVRRIEVQSMALAASAAATRLTVEKITYRGFPSSTAILEPCKRDTTDETSNVLAATSVSGITVTSAVPWLSFLLASALSPAEKIVPVENTWEIATGGFLRLRSGEGLWFRQPEAGVTSDPRRFNINLAWREHTDL